ncbi:ATP-binding cassette domain-containing protein [uncultured Thiohalocapsa sp.]|uniref:ATP-binding cassette domain-containing protein n=1 Tax=uncultured Thiohalocapsa sp. TaxID=768990 RepID=UPI0025F24FD5|nr:ATP-binding cassette domain-containing protein [uncultured Thiohalocapsa sp.]
MALSIFRLFARESDAPRGQIVAMAGLAGAAVTFMMMVVNAAADRIAAGRLGLETPLLFLLGWSINNAAQRYAATESVRAVETSLRRVRLRVADKVRRCGLRFVEAQGGVAAFDPLLRDAGMLSQGVLLLVRGAKSMLMLACALAYLFWLSPASALTLLLVLGVLLPILVSHFRITAGELARADAADARYASELAGQLAGFKELMADRRVGDGVAAELSRLCRQTEAVRRASNRRQMREILLTQGAGYLVLTLVVFLVPALVQASAETVLTVTATALFLTDPMLTLASALPMMAKVDAAVSALYDLEARVDKAVATADGLTPSATFIEAGPAFERIVLDGVAFQYADGGEQAFAVGPLDLTLRRGELVFIVGGNGSGKSTLLKLLTGLYRPQAGRVLLDGQVIDDDARPGYRTRFATVFTDSHLFERLYGLPEIDPADVNRGLAELGLADKTCYTDEGFSNLALSTGQKKRIALLAALLKERPILVLDELAADQDPDFRRHFYEQMLPTLKEDGLTVICVTHDDHWFHVADRVLAVSDGRLLERAG